MYIWFLQLLLSLWLIGAQWHWVRQWLVACLAPSHYLNQCYLIVTWIPRELTSVQVYLKFKNVFIEDSFENIVSKIALISSRPQCANVQALSWFGISTLENLLILHEWTNWFQFCIMTCQLMASWVEITWWRFNNVGDIFGGIIWCYKICRLATVLFIDPEK